MNERQERFQSSALYEEYTPLGRREESARSRHRTASRRDRSEYDCCEANPKYGRRSLAFSLIALHSNDPSRCMETVASTESEQNTSLGCLRDEANELLTACLTVEQACEQKLQANLGSVYSKAPQQALQVQEALQLILQGKEELFQLIALAQSRARRSSAATATLRALDLQLRKVETALKLVQDLLALRDAAQSLEKLLHDDDIDLDRACGLVAEFCQQRAGSEFYGDSDAFGSAEVTLLEQRVEEARQQLRSRIRRYAEQLFTSETGSVFDEGTERALLTHVERLRKLGYTSEAQEFLVRYAREYALHRVSQRLAQDRSPATPWLEQLTALYEAIAETVARFERMATWLDENDRRQILLQLEQLANQRGAETVRGFIKVTGLERRCKGRGRLHQHRSKTSSAPSTQHDTETIYDIELLQFGNVAQVGGPRGASPLKDGNREPVESDTSELEVLLEQLVIMSRRTAMFRHFLLSRLGIATDFEQERRREGPLYLMMQELMGMYVLLEQNLLYSEWLAARALEDTGEQTGSDQPIDRDQASKPVEYTFYAIKRSIGRAIQAYDPDALCATLNHVNALLTGPCLENLTKRLQTELPSLSIFAPAQMVFGHTFKVQTPRGLVRSTNDAQTSSLYLRRLIGVTIPKGISEAQLPESASLAPILMEMEATAEEFQQLANQGIRSIFQTLRTSALERAAEQALCVLVPSSSATSASAAWSYQISESTYQPGPSLPVVRLFELVYQEALEPLLPQLTTDAFAELVCLVAEWTRDRFEQATIGRRCSMNALGALAFDADVRYLMNRFAGLVETHRTRVRASFRRLSHVALILTVDRPAEVSEFWAQVRDSLSADQVRQLLQLRVEFRPEAIQALSLS